ncbi:ribonucleotide reductase [Rhodococcus phage Trina]|uniref:Ribonucleoside-diphosphate reductase n=1 Tax=Rhodococcus phage Trina TaxID=2027905 RepID=A0A2D0ZM61_9CAUD|nr:ribonucleotide reductase [Rhodococcus phage Trina]ASZ74875.1 ribonucleoside reductase [Rhodococcus phage Trina]
MTNVYEQYSAERKAGQQAGEVPDWYITPGYQMFNLKYIEPGQTLKQRYERIAEYAGGIATRLYGEGQWEARFFNAIWKGWLSPSTPVLANLGTDRGMAVSCTGNYVDDSIYGFYDSRLESAILTKNGFGTSSYLGDIRARGSKFSDNGKANGVVPVAKGFVQDMDDTSQGSTRRGAWAGYLEADHDDFDELIDYMYNHPDGLNLGWIISDAFIQRLKDNDKETIRRYQKILKARAVTGKGYMFFVDKVNKQNPSSYAENNLSVKASNLCCEIALHSDADHSFSCVLSSLNLAKYDEWKDTDLVFTSTVFLDCIAQDLIDKGSKIKGMEKVVRFTEKSRALGLGVMGYHTLLQKRSLPFDSPEAFALNKEVFGQISHLAGSASRYMAQEAGSPEWAPKGRRNTHLMAIAPTMSTALLVGGVSQGIEPIVANVFNQSSAAGEMARINPTLIEIMKERGVYDQSTIDFIIDDNGSVRNVDWLNDHEKQVFKTAYEINQEAVVQQASDRQQHIDQGQSLNLFFDANESPAYISKIHKQAMLDPYIKGLYYMRSKAGIQASKG